MAGEVKHYFARGNTAIGAYNLFDSAFQGIKHLYMLTGGPGTGKSTIIGNIANKMTEAGYDVQLFHDPSDHESLEGLIVDDMSIGIVDGLACRLGLAEMPGVTVKVVDLGSAVDVAQLDTLKSQVLRLEKQANLLFSKAYETFGKAKSIHDEWETLYIEHMDFAAANLVTEQLIDSIIGNIGEQCGVTDIKTTAGTVNANRKKRKGKIRHLFLGAATPFGPVDFVPNLTANMQRTVFIKGRPGSGKSTMLKKIVTAVTEQGMDVEMFHCGLDPNSLDMVIVPSLQVAVFDSTAPHEYFPRQEHEEILDMYEKTMNPETDELVATTAKELAAKYKTAIKEATSYLLEAKHVCDEIKALYASVTDFEQVRKLQDKLLKDLKFNVETR